MHTSRVEFRNRLSRRRVVGLTAGIVLCLVSTAALAQRGGGPRLTPEKQEAAWTLQAEGVAKAAEVSEENTPKVVAAYIASRKNLQEAMGSLGGGGGMREEIQKLYAAERERLTEALTQVLPEEQVGSVAGPLGTFYREWDRLVDALAGLELSAEKQEEGLALIAAYVVESDKAMQGASGGDWQALMDGWQARKTKLDGDLAEQLGLTPEQAETWKQATMVGRGRGTGGSPPPTPPAPPASPAPAEDADQ